MTYEVIILGHLHMPLYFIGTFTEYSQQKTSHPVVLKPRKGKYRVLPFPFGCNMSALNGNSIQ